MFRFLFSIAVAAFVACSGAIAQTVVVDFEDLAFSSHNYSHTNPVLNGQSFMNGQTLNALAPPASGFTSYGANFNASYSVDPMYGPISGAWAYSNVYSPAAVSFTEPYVAFNLHPTAGVGTNGAGGSAKYAVANNYYQGDATITLPEGYRPLSLSVANTTYAALTMRDGDINGYARKFGEADAIKGADGRDWFLLTIVGKNSATSTVTGTKLFYLADYRSGNAAEHYILDRWTAVDISDFAPNTDQIVFELSSSDNTVYNGFPSMNTPSYFALDNLVLTPVPEPGSILALAAGAGLLVRWRRRRGK